MHRTDATGNAGGLFTKGNAAAHIGRTVLGAKWLNAAQEELAAIPLAAGLALDDGDNTQVGQAILLLGFPLGAIVAVAGTFGAANNSGGHDAGAVVIGPNWKQCDGSQIVDAASPFVGRYVPKLDDGRFLRGNVTAGGIGGQASLNPSSAFAAAGSYTPAGSPFSHNHGLSSHTHSATTGGSSASTDKTGASDAFSHSTHTHGLTSGAPIPASTGPQNPGFTGTAAARSGWFLNAPVNFEPVYLGVTFYQRIK